MSSTDVFQIQETNLVHAEVVIEQSTTRSRCRGRLRGFILRLRGDRFLGHHPLDLKVDVLVLHGALFRVHHAVSRHIVRNSSYIHRTVLFFAVNAKLSLDFAHVAVFSVTHGACTA